MSCWIPSGKPTRSVVVRTLDLRTDSDVQNNTLTAPIITESSKQGNSIPPVVEETSKQGTDVGKSTKQDVGTSTNLGETPGNSEKNDIKSEEPKKPDTKTEEQEEPEKNDKQDLQERYARAFEVLAASYKTLDIEAGNGSNKLHIDKAALEVSANPENIPPPLFISQPNPKPVEADKKESTAWTVLGN